MVQPYKHSMPWFLTEDAPWSYSGPSRSYVSDHGSGNNWSVIWPHWVWESRTAATYATDCSSRQISRSSQHWVPQWLICGKKDSCVSPVMQAVLHSQSESKADREDITRGEWSSTGSKMQEEYSRSLSDIPAISKWNWVVTAEQTMLECVPFHQLDIVRGKHKQMITSGL